MRRGTNVGAELAVTGRETQTVARDVAPVGRNAGDIVGTPGSGAERTRRHRIRERRGCDEAGRVGAQAGPEGLSLGVC